MAVQSLDYIALLSSTRLIQAVCYFSLQVKQNVTFLQSYKPIGTLPSIVNQCIEFCQNPPKGFEKYYPKDSNASSKANEEAKSNESSKNAPPPPPPPPPPNRGPSGQSQQQKPFDPQWPFKFGGSAK